MPLLVLLLLIAAAVFFILAAAGAPRANWIALGLLAFVLVPLIRAAQTFH